MTDREITRARKLIAAKLGRIPESDRSEIASQVLGALAVDFVLLPKTSETEEAATRAQTTTVLPWLYSSKEIG